MNDLEFRINSSYFLDLKIKTIKPRISNLRWLIGYCSIILKKSKINKKSSFSKDFLELQNLIDIKFKKGNYYEITPNYAPMPEQMIPFYHRIVDYLTRRN